ncbi:PepSY domain-containing protein [Rhodococcus sp. H36-A4]|uniref:PepSY-associated TM helix domain-containing protein n=1 Tax=Rhodococcus sp. H36-A4 TaxID=3004353 RepID=UPI0022AF6C2E|nr:PepSY domain-containing protein [Rhodococcus sp. H36-A4]MCZ4077909.1 PepSY domain-containing protein [Rhodococcus sp. H36-A4]
MPETGTVEGGTVLPSTDASGSTGSRPRPSLVMRLHFYAGILIAPFILVAAISGGLYALAPTAENIVYSDLLQTNSSGPTVSVAEQVTAAQQVRPDLTVSAVRPSTEVGDTTRVMFTDTSLGQSEQMAVFVDPVTGRSVGESVVYGSSNALPIRTWIGQLHRNLHLGEPGRIYSELAASWLWVVALGGVVLWVRRYRRGGRLLTVDRSVEGRVRTRNWHGGVGIWTAVGLIFLSATGLTWSASAGENITELRTALKWTTPALSTSAGEHAGHDMPAMTPIAPDSFGSSVGRVDAVLGTARSQGIDGKVEVTIPTDPSSAFVVTQTRQPFVFSPSSIAIDGATNDVVDTNWFSEWPLAAKLSTWGIALHMGILFGLVNQIALALLVAALVTVIVRGYLMWWQRRPVGAVVGSPAARGGFARRSLVKKVAFVIGFAALGWFVPLLGISLLVFLIIDAALGVRHRTNTMEAS